MIYEFEGFRPVIHESAFVHPTASVIGNVIIGRDVYVGPGAALRGDWGGIEIEDGCNVQEGCVVHMFPGVVVVLESSAHLGHGSVVHGARIGQHACPVLQPADLVLGAHAADFHGSARESVPRRLARSSALLVAYDDMRGRIDQGTDEILFRPDHHARYGEEKSHADRHAERRDDGLTHAHIEVRRGDAKKDRESAHAMAPVWMRHVRRRDYPRAGPRADR